MDELRGAEADSSVSMGDRWLMALAPLALASISDCLAACDQELHGVELWAEIGFAKESVAAFRADLKKILASTPRDERQRMLENDRLPGTVDPDRLISLRSPGGRREAHAGDVRFPRLLLVSDAELRLITRLIEVSIRIIDDWEYSTLVGVGKKEMGAISDNIRKNVASI